MFSNENLFWFIMAKAAMEIIVVNNVLASGVSQSGITTGVNGILDGVFNLFALIFASLGGFNFVQAILAYGETKSEGGSAQAAGKLTSHVTIGMVMAAAAILMFTVFKNALKSMMGL